MNKLTYALMFFIVCIVYGCYYDNEEELYGVEECVTDNVTYVENIWPIIAANCAITDCHVPGTGEIVFQSYSDVKDAVDNFDLRERVVVIKDMPLDATLSACDIEKIDIWLSAGAVNN